MQANLKRLFGVGKIKTPSNLSNNFRPLNDSRRSTITNSLLINYFTRDIWGEAKLSPEVYLSTPEGRKDFEDQLHKRLDHFRQTVIPWLNDAMALSGKHILEIGCGTGSSTVALLEQGAKVTAVDIDETSLIVAGDRCAAYGLQANIQKANATEVHNIFGNQHFDLIIYFATLEHMTHTERISAMRTTWDMLPNDAFWCILDTPNRLWFFDGHTAQLPFFHWLPDELAFQYSRFSGRKLFNTSFRKIDDEAMLSFLRHGRGISYHEFDLAIKKVEELSVVSCLHEQNPLRTLARKLARTTNYRYEALLADVGPKIHRGFYRESLDMIVRKN